MQTNHIAVYWDFENIHGALVDDAEGDGAYRQTKYKPQKAYVNLGAIMDYVASIGTTVVCRAYANWQWLIGYRNELMRYAVDLVQIFPRGSHAKNGADIRLALDALEDTHHYPHITHVVIVGSDSDYIAVAQKLRQAGKIVIGVGVQGSTNDYWVRACNEFKFYKTLLGKVGEQAARVRAELQTESDLNEAKDLLLLAIQHLTAERGDDEVVKASVRPMMTRLDPTFDEGNYGFASFSNFLEACNDVVHVETGEFDHIVRLAESGDMGESKRVRKADWLATSPQKRGYERILKDQGIRLVPPGWRRSALKVLLELFGEAEKPIPSWSDLDERLSQRLKQRGLSGDMTDVRKLRYIVYKARLFKLHGNAQGVSFTADMTLNEVNAKIEGMLIKRIAQHAVLPLDADAICEILYGDDGDLYPLADSLMKTVVAQVEAGIDDSAASWEA